MKQAMIIKSQNDGILGVATNKKAAYQIIEQYGKGGRLSKTYAQLCKEIRDVGYGFVDTQHSGVWVRFYDVNQYDPEC